jgi:hypothetical protein
MRERHKTGSLVFDRSRGTWRFLQWVDGKRKSQTIGTKQEYPTKAAAWKAVKPLTQVSTSTAPNVSTLVEQYRTEKMPKRHSTRQGYNSWRKNHIVPKWGACVLSDVQARPAELWLESLTLAPKSRREIRGLLRILWDFAMWRGDVPTQRNPMELVTVKGASKRGSKPRSLTVAEFQKFIVQLGEPFRTMALLCVCFGLRISECLALRWSDVNWLDRKLTVERGIVCQHVDDVKTTESRKQLSTEDSGSISLEYTYTNRAKATLRLGSPIHDGAARLKVVSLPDRGLQGEYWTSRCTTGDMLLHYFSKDLLDTFSDTPFTAD